MTSNIQPMGVAGMFYPADAGALAAEVDARLAKVDPPALSPKAVIAPHAGHIYSGDIAASAYALLQRRRNEIKRVVLLGPNHRVAFRGMALSPADRWATPLGMLPVDRISRDALAREPGVAVVAQPFSGEHSLEVHLPFIQRALGDVEILPILAGQTPPGQVSRILEKFWGGPETAIVVSSDLSHFHDYETCTKKDAGTAAAIERLQPDGLEGDRACGHFPIHGLIDQAQRRDLRATALDLRNSGDTEGPRDRVVGYGAFAFEYAHSATLDTDLRKNLIERAKEVVRNAAEKGGAKPDLTMEDVLPRPLLAQRASFVTLTIAGHLRGCRGSLLAHRSLIADVADNAFKSAYDDPRFPPLRAEELEHLDVHISILSTPRRIFADSEAALARVLRPDIDGLILRDGRYQGLLLPSVWQHIPDPVTFIRQVKLKAGLPAAHWSASLEAYRFGAESFGVE
jgi:AmmeMemoRadiSam system protein B/AmmeMemoRadiSam system protein A